MTATSPTGPEGAEVLEADYLVIGSGLAGLYFALRASQHGRVLVVTKRAPAESNTSYAQGGVAAVLDPSDRMEAHIEDTMRVGEGLCHRDTVERCVREAPEHILRFANDLGVPFDRDPDGHFELGREGGHTARRIAHAKDATGARHRARAARPRRRACRSHHHPVRPPGAGPADDRQVRRAERRLRRLHLRPGAPGNVAHRSGARRGPGDRRRRQGVPVHDQPRRRDRRRHRDGVSRGRAHREHGVLPVPPHVPVPPAAKSFLISEALRGEGGILRLRDGTPFMPRYHEMKDLAPRDIVARAIDAELKRTGDDYVVLDMTHLPGDFVTDRFPMIHAALPGARHRHAHARPSRSCPRPTTAAAASPSTSTAAAPSATCTRSARRR